MGCLGVLCADLTKDENFTSRSGTTGEVVNGVHKSPKTKKSNNDDCLLSPWGNPFIGYV